MSIFDEARKKIEEILKASKVTYANPAGQNFKSLVGAQQIAQVASSPTLNRVAQTVNKIPAAVQNPVQTLQKVNTRVQNFQLPTQGGGYIQNMNPVGIQATNFALNTFLKPMIGSALIQSPEQKRMNELSAKTNRTLQEFKELANLSGQESLTYAMGMVGGPTSKGGFSKTTLQNVRSAMNDRGFVSKVGEFAQKVESSKYPNKLNLGQLGDYMQSVAEELFGPRAASMTNTQIKNAMDLLMQQASGVSSSVKKIGLSAQSARKDAKAGLSIKPTQASKGVEATSSQLGKGQNLFRTPEDFGRISPQELKQSQSRILGKAQSDLPSSTPNVPGNVVPPSSSSIDPVSKIVEALKQAKPIRGEQEALYSKARSQQSGALAGIGKELGGEQTYYKKLGQLKGELPKAQFESIKSQLGQADIDSLFNKVEQSVLSPFEKVTAQTGLRKLLGEGGGVVPTKGELSLLGEIFPPEFIQAVMQNRSTFQKLLSLTEGALNLPRAVMATADLSAPMRQGIFLVGRPKQFVPAFKDMFKFAFNENSYKGFMESVKTRPTYPLMRQAKLAITDMGPDLLKREESFMSNLVEKIPGFGTIAKGSNRAYSGFLNKLRADVFDDLVKKAESQGVKMEGKTLADLGSFINSATGRGDLPQALNRAAPLLNGVFFSPRLMASRVNLLNPVFYAKLDPFVRKEALKSLLGFGGTALTVLGLAKLGGAEVGDDPRSSDFGKIKVGNTRYDVLGGFQQYIKLSAQLLSGQVVSSTTGKVMTLGEGYKPLTRKDIIARFFESKESPVASFVTALATGQNGMGEDVNVPSEVISRFIPLVIQDMYDITKDKDSIAQGLFMAAPGFFGVGSQTYGKQELVTGKNKIGQETMQTRPVPDLPTAISDKLFGTKPLGTSTSYSVDAYYKQLKAMPREQAAQTYDQIAKTNPDLAKQINQVIKDEQKGITVADKTLKGKGVASGDRATAIAGEFKKLQTQEEKAKLWEDYVKKGIITKEVAQQLAILAKRGEL